MASSIANRTSMVTFARPLVSGVLEIDPSTDRPPHSHHNQHCRTVFVFSSQLPSSDSVLYHNTDSVGTDALSPILAGHPNHAVTASIDLNSSPAVCRICYSGEESGPNEGEPLISPCHCKGTMGLYHRTCLNKWLVVSQRTHCEICQFNFQIKRTSPSFWAYVRSGHPRPVMGLPLTVRGTILTDFMCFLLLTPLVFLSATVCFLSGWHLIQGNSSNLASDGPHKEIGIGLLCLSTLLLLAYFIWLGVTFFYHRRDYRSWQSKNWNYTVVDQLSMEESILVNGTESGGMSGRRRQKERRTRI
uniref:RING-CH-type domain-containing protein n=1 Tax=Globodera rostochiensis TaxID=31243 RepID=A0A914HYH1_GLORO